MRSEPAAGARLDKVPHEVMLELAEPPAPGSSVTVRDGCGRDVATDVAASEEDSILSGELHRGRPGRWRVRFESISAVDGHLVRGGFRFEVEGKRKCGKGGVAIGTGKPRLRPSDDEEGSGFPILPLALGTVALVAVALVARRSTS